MVSDATNTRVSAVGIGRKLSELKSLLQERYGMTEDGGKKESKQYTFHRPVGDGEKVGDEHGASTPKVNLAETGGWDCLGVDGSIISSILLKKK
jgi:hypothetical protein